ncbi:MAG TPA: PEP-CTERM sorting domain-containing protein [Planctomycetota bacterium]|nr:PEP-CTERM sorting domain-containing protein [Planctomycetota bacterium]
MKSFAIVIAVAGLTLVLGLMLPVRADVMDATPVQPVPTPHVDNIHGEDTEKSTLAQLPPPSSAQTAGTIPEPASALLVGLSLLGAGLVRRRMQH